MKRLRGLSLRIPINPPRSDDPPSEHAAYQELVRMEAVKRFKKDDVRAVPYEERSVDYLRYDCIARGIHPDHRRDVMIARLRAHDRGEYTPAVAAVMTKLEILHQQAPVYALGTMTLLGLPHDIIRIKILRHLSDANLFAMLYVCKYVHNDALAILIERTYTLLRIKTKKAKALYLWNSLQGIASFRPVNNFLALRCVLFPDTRPRPTSFAHVETFKQGIVNCKSSVEYVQLAYQKYCKKQRERNADVVAIYQGKDSRLVECNNLLHEIGFPKWYRIFSWTRFDIIPFKVKFVDKIIPSLYERILHVVQPYILTSQPRTVKSQLLKLLKFVNIPLLCQCLHTTIDYNSRDGMDVVTSVQYLTEICIQLYNHQYTLCNIPVDTDVVGSISYAIANATIGFTHQYVYIFWPKDQFLKKPPRFYFQTSYRAIQELPPSCKTITWVTRTFQKTFERRALGIDFGNESKVLYFFYE